MTLYDDLGVPSDASEGEITRAYRKKAQKHHPDRDRGDAAKFHEITVAYNVLTDPDRRKRYDETGQTDQHDHKQEALEQLAALMLQIIDAGNVDSLDIIEAMRGQVRETMATITKKIESARRSIQKHQRAMKRLNNKKGRSNVLANMIAAHIRQMEEGISRAEDEFKKGDLMLELLLDYEYKVDQLPTAASIRWGGIYT